jgi:hypothetical protein
LPKLVKVETPVGHARQLSRFALAPDPDYRAGHPGLSQYPGEGDLCGAPRAPLADRAECRSKRCEVEGGEGVTPAEIVRVERIDVERVREEATGKRRPREHADPMLLRQRQDFSLGSANARPTISSARPHP